MFVYLIPLPNYFSKGFLIFHLFLIKSLLSGHRLNIQLLIGHKSLLALLLSMNWALFLEQQNNTCTSKFKPYFQN